MTFALSVPARLVDYADTENKYTKSKNPPRTEITLKRVIVLGLQGFLAFAAVYIILTTIQSQRNSAKEIPSKARAAKVTGSHDVSCVLPEENCREKYLRENLGGLTNFEQRKQHPRFKYELVIASIMCSEWYFYNKTECHSPGEEPFHEDFFCTQQQLRLINDDEKTFNYVTQHCAKYNFRIRSEEVEDSDELKEM